MPHHPARATCVGPAVDGKQHEAKGRGHAGRYHEHGEGRPQPRRLRHIALGTIARAEDWLAGPTSIEEDLD